ncbi:selenide, water dikinase SelD [Oceaniovalibus sp. ACAM 378]|uniref:selenide, water dikinase SelD n=1 Tax=Oceaniovalibus sp. ACAM 378 TaxID=2599923 RepID=UPI0011D97DAB|nr:selenide, water dikinase SelD [Oceaniovalibus sp. ACAM 378]TYB91012.1 selenide, water dikinase SelD [Oceaniovalibus sp. ACAM 378]
MQSPPLPLTRDLVLIGGGHAHALVLRAWGMAPLAGVRLSVINPGPTAPYTGMLPGFVAGHYNRSELDIDLVRLARFAGARLILGSATGIDIGRGEITLNDRPPVPYDVASFDIGIHSAMPDLPGFANYGIPAKPLGRFAESWQDHLELVADTPALADAGLAVIGGGVAGIELSMAMAHGTRQAAGRVGPVHVVETKDAMIGLGKGAARALRQRLADMGITLLEQTAVAGLEPDGVRLADGRHVPSAFTVGAAGARPYRWLEQTGLPLHNGFLRVGETLQIQGADNLFAVGDCAHMDHAPRPKAGVFAVRQAPILLNNLCAALGAGKMQPYRPQRDYLKLISLGRRAAVADKFGLRLEGEFLWRWKDRIDRTFMFRLADLQTMPAAPLPKRRADGVDDAIHGGKAMCGGCGSKLGQGSLAAVLADLPTPTRSDVRLVAGDDAAVLRFGEVDQVISTDHLRALTDDPWVMARIAVNHAMGDVHAMGAKPQAALVTAILPRGNDRLHRRILSELMASAAAAVGESGAALAGGHTMVGDALAIGVTVTGTSSRAITLAGARAGDVLILTKPLGTGVIMAAEMALAARGEWVAAALESMQRAQGSAAEILCDAHAMTDVTGFGLYGHLLGLVRASGCGARLDLGAVPLLDGALALAEAGHRSTLFPANREIGGHTALPDTARCDLLFDPQTAGGLLAAVAPEAADSLIAALRTAGHPAARIGEITEGPPTIKVV